MSSHSYALVVWLVTQVIAVGIAAVAARVDVVERRLPNRIVAAAGAVGWAGLVVTNIVDSTADSATESTIWSGAARALITLVVFAGPLVLLWLVRPDLIGGGDVKLAAAVAPLLAWPTAGYAFVGLLAVSVSATPHAVLSARRNRSLPLGPYIVVGAVVGGVLGLVVG